MPNMMFTLSSGISYYIVGNKYYRNSGWLNKEISKAEYVKVLHSNMKWLQELMTEKECIKAWMLILEGGNDNA